MTHTEPTPSELQEILDSSLDSTSLQAHIDASAFEVHDIADAEPSISDDRLKQIHLYLSAHYATAQEKRLSSQSGESRSLSYSSEDSASYFETAKRLDPTDTVSGGAKPKASVGVPEIKDLPE